MGNVDRTSLRVHDKGTCASHQKRRPQKKSTIPLLGPCRPRVRAACTHGDGSPCEAGPSQAVRCRTRQFPCAADVDLWLSYHLTRNRLEFEWESNQLVLKTSHSPPVRATSEGTTRVHACNERDGPESIKRTFAKYASEP